jgi:hypothetical protein
MSKSTDKSKIFLCSVLENIVRVFIVLLKNKNNNMKYYQSFLEGFQLALPNSIKYHFH